MISLLSVVAPAPSPYVIGNYYVGLLTLIVIILLCMSGVFALIGGIFQGFGVYTLARRRGYKEAVTAFVPVAGNYVLGAIYDDISRYENKISNRRIWLVSWSAIATALWVIWITAFVIFLLRGHILVYFQGYVDQLIVPLLTVLAVAILIQIITHSIKYSVLKKIFKDYEPDNAILFTVLATFFSFLIPYLLFAIREKPSVTVTITQTTIKGEM